jgi:hypothetical protein
MNCAVHENSRVGCAISGAGKLWIYYASTSQFHPYLKEKSHLYKGLIGCHGEMGNLPYFQIDEIVQSGDYESLTFNAKTGSMELISGNSWTSYDSPETFNIKYRYAFDNCMRGIMWWVFYYDAWTKKILLITNCSLFREHLGGLLTSLLNQLSFLSFNLLLALPFLWRLLPIPSPQQFTPLHYRRHLQPRRLQ